MDKCLAIETPGMSVSATICDASSPRLTCVSLVTASTQSLAETILRG
jgi:hypothetical protein